MPVFLKHEEEAFYGGRVSGPWLDPNYGLSRREVSTETEDSQLADWLEEADTPAPSGFPKDELRQASTSRAYYHSGEQQHNNVRLQPAAAHHRAAPLQGLVPVSSYPHPSPMYSTGVDISGGGSPVVSAATSSLFQRTESPTPLFPPPAIVGCARYSSGSSGSGGGGEAGDEVGPREGGHAVATTAAASVADVGGLSGEQRRDAAWWAYAR